MHMHTPSSSPKTEMAPRKLLLLSSAPLLLALVLHCGGGSSNNGDLNKLVQSLDDHGDLPFTQGLGLASFHGDLPGGSQNDVDDVVQAWYMDDDDAGAGAEEEEDQRLPHHRAPDEPVSLAKLRDLGIVALRLDADDYEQDDKLTIMRQQRGYLHLDIVELTPKKLPNYDTMIKRFFKEHLHTDEEVRYCLDGSGYFDVRDENDRWVRVSLKRGAVIIVPAGIYHRFTLDSKNYIKAMRLFSGSPDWTAYNRPHDHLPARKAYLATLDGRPRLWSLDEAAACRHVKKHLSILQ